MSPTPFWIEAAVAGLLVASGLFVLVSAIGFLRLPDFFLRMHPPALAYTFGTWCVTLADILYFSTIESRRSRNAVMARPTGTGGRPLNIRSLSRAVSRPA